VGTVGGSSLLAFAEVPEYATPLRAFLGAHRANLRAEYSLGLEDVDVHDGGIIVPVPSIVGLWCMVRSS